MNNIFQNRFTSVVILLLIISLLNSCVAETSRALYREHVPFEKYIIVMAYSGGKQGDRIVGKCQGVIANEASTTITIPLQECSITKIIRTRSGSLFGRASGYTKIYYPVYDNSATVPFTEQEQQMIRLLLQKRKEMGGCENTEVRIPTGMNAYP